jgi:hypothetical protein
VATTNSQSIFSLGGPKRSKDLLWLQPLLTVRLQCSRANINLINSRLRTVVLLGLAATAFLVIVAATLVYPHHTIYSEMFIVPVGALFAFTGVRANLPGAPDGFGKLIDLTPTFASHTSVLNPKERLSVRMQYILRVLPNELTPGPDMFSTLPVLIIMSFCVSGLEQKCW